MRSFVVLVFVWCISAEASPVRVLEASGDRLLVEFVMPPATLSVSGAGPYQEWALPGAVPRAALPGLPRLPFFAELIAAPPGAAVSVEVLEAPFTDYEAVDYAIAEGGESAEGLEQLPYEPGMLWPQTRATLAPAGTIRGVPAHALHLYPLAYHTHDRTLRVYERLVLALRFEGGYRGDPLPATATVGPAASLYAPFLNPPRYRQSPAAAGKPTQGTIDSGWYDPAKKWVKVIVVEDNIHRIDRVWLERRFLDVDGIDPRTLRLFLDGVEQLLYVEGEEDGSFDEEDFLLFYGHERRYRDAQGVERDHDSLYGNKNIYWLCWGDEPGKRFSAQSGAPINDYPVSEWYWEISHFEFDREFDQFEFATDNRGDHWFEKKVEAKTAGAVASNAVWGDIFSPFLDEEYLARLRVALHGWSSLGHHTVVKFNNQEIDDSIWGGQVEFLVDAEIPPSLIADDPTNTVTVQAIADQAPFDKVYINWFELQYRRRYDTFPGHLVFTQTASSGRRITLRKFVDPDVTLFDVANGVRITDALVEPSPDGLFVATFEDAPPAAPLYVVTDELSVAWPRGLVDIASDWRSTANGADYVIITHDLFVNASRRLAEHRRQDGLEVEIVNVQDIYDEFSGGQMLREAIAEFIDYAYHHWERPPAYVLLMGDATYDYRNIIGGDDPKPSFVPSQYYQARLRGHSPSDYLYALVDGDDLLPDLAVGRLAVESSEQAENTVGRIIRYDTDPEGGDWRSRVIYLANYHAKKIFSDPSDSLAAQFSEPFGLESVKVYSPANDWPSPTGKAFLDALNAGALLVNFAGHGSAGNMQYIFGLQEVDWGYLSQVDNGRRLPLVLALSCLNGMFVHQTTDALAEVFTTMEDGGAIAYISASAISFVTQNDLLSEHLYQQVFEDGLLGFGPTLNAAKTKVLTANSSFVEAALTMQLFGDPAQELALPAGPDYTPLSLRPRSAQLLRGERTEVEIELRNNTRRTADSLTVSLFGFSDGAVTPDTIAQTLHPPFSGTRTLDLDWSIDTGAGPYRLELVVDADDRVDEIDEGNNALAVEVEILEPAAATLLFPPANGLVQASDLTLEALVPVNASANRYRVEFLLGTEHDFAPASALAASEAFPAVDGIAVYAPGVDLDVAGFTLPASGADLFWRARIVDGTTVGAWSSSRGFSLFPGAVAAVDSAAGERWWRQQGPQLLGGDAPNLALDDAGHVRISTSPLPFRPDAEHREDSFAVDGLEGTGVVCTDGTYLFAKRWFNDGSTIYPGVDRFARIGTGFNGTEAGRLYEFLADPVSAASISATCHGDGFIYNGNGNPFELERISTATGQLDTIAVPDGMLEWKSGIVEDPCSGAEPERGPCGRFLIASDGRYLYNASMSTERGLRTGWGVRVFEPSDGWRLVREFTSPPTETAFTFRWTDGLLADGERLYLLEFGGGYRIRMIDAVDGHFLDEWVSEQEATHSVAGQYDWVNNRVWLGDLRGPDVYRYAGLRQLSSGSVTTDPLGPAHTWSSLDVEAVGALRLDVLGVDASAEGGWRALEGYQDLESAHEDLSAIDATRHPLLRLRASLLRDASDGAALAALQVRFTAMPSLLIAGLDHTVDDGLHAEVTIRNLSPFTVTGARVVAITEDGDEVAAVIVPRLRRGETHIATLHSIPMPAPGRRLFARVETPRPDADPADNVFEIELSQTLPAFAFSLWPDGRPFVSGDPLVPGQALLIAAPAGADVEGEIELTVGDHVVEPDSALSAGLVLYRPDAAAGDHLLRVGLVTAATQRYHSEMRIVVTAGLTLANPLVYPNPATGPSTFTYVLSHEAEVAVDLYALNGRLIRRLSPQRQPPGFGQITWNGRGEGGNRLANGTYLYLLRARADDGSVVEHRAPFVIAR